MKCRFLLVLVLIFTVSGRAQKAQDFFPKADLMKIGVYYYPEHWDESQWERDLANIAKLGFEFIHMAEFAWPFMEPQEGKFTFDWLDKAIDLAGKQGLKVILCTPTPCPPAWLAEKHPEIFYEDINYRIREHGSRGNYSTSSDLFRDYTQKIVSEMARRYGNDARVWGWQLDNEPGAPMDYSDKAQEKFRLWLKEKYGTIQALNDAWGNRFWGVLYDNFEQIRIPVPNILYGLSPHARLDYARFNADQMANFLDFQAEVLRQYISNKQWITTNYISNSTQADQRRTEKLDFIAYTIYPVGNGDFSSPEQFRLGWLDGIAFANDFYRSIDGVTGVMELQPGQVNWARVNPQPQPGAVRMWLWHAFAGDCSFACTYRYRQPLYGSEQYHYGIVGTDGVTPLPGGLEYSRVTGEMRQLRKAYNPKAKLPAAYQSRRTAILWSHDNFWDIDLQPRTSEWSTWNHVFKYMEIAKSFGAPVDWIAEDTDFNAYPFLIVPAYQLIDQGLVAKWQEYAKQGGNLIITCRTGHKDRNGHLFAGKWAEPILDLIGAQIEFYDLLPGSAHATVKMQGLEYKWHVWGDVLLPEPGTETLAIYADQFYAGKTAVVSRKLGKGTVTYIGIDTDDGALEKAVLQKIYNNAGVPVQNYPAGVYVEWRDGFWVAVNYSAQPYTLDIPANAKIMLGEKLLPSPGVTVWMEN
ncbi:MAG TPA: beta-galactosidase [bacterium]|nr:beta-galactosidase [bacterium]HPN42961.1 beta-galactosidase [bacterium]